MSEPIRMVVGLLDEPFERNQEAAIITMAAGALAAVAAVGNRDPETLMAVLTAITQTDQTLSEASQTKLRVIADELIEAARAGKPFIALAHFRRLS